MSTHAELMAAPLPDLAMRTLRGDRQSGAALAARVREVCGGAWLNYSIRERRTIALAIRYVNDIGA